ILTHKVFPVKLALHGNNKLKYGKLSIAYYRKNTMRRFTWNTSDSLINLKTSSLVSVSSDILDSEYPSIAMGESSGSIVKNKKGLSDSTDNIKVIGGTEIWFSNYSENYCVSIVDIVGSTSLVSSIRSSEKVRMFYSIFINAMADEIKKYNGRIVKTMGDGIMS